MHSFQYSGGFATFLLFSLSFLLVCFVYFCLFLLGFACVGYLLHFLFFVPMYLASAL